MTKKPHVYKARSRVARAGVQAATEDAARLSKRKPRTQPLGYVSRWSRHLGDPYLRPDFTRRKSGLETHYVGRLVSL
jgi:hypothetical protein